MRGLMQERRCRRSGAPPQLSGDRASLEKQELPDSCDGKVARWMTPGDVVLVEELPHTATGKLVKRTLREAYAGYFMDGGRDAG